MTYRLGISLFLGLAIIAPVVASDADQTRRAASLDESATQANEKPTKKEGTSMANDSAFTWGYFFAAPDKASVQGLAGERKQSMSLYRVEKIVAVKGKPGVELAPGATLVRVEAAAKLPALGEGSKASLLFQGVPQHLQYTTKAQREDLTKRSRADLPPSKDTVTVIIPIRKNATWWAMSTDERMAHFQKMGEKIGHSGIGADYVEKIYRKLYHTRYAVENKDHDFITYFEFERAHEKTFQALCAKLRDPQENPEWAFVDQEYEIWTTKVE